MAKKIQVRLIMQLRAAGMSQTAIARERHMSKSSVSDVFQIAEERNISYADLVDKTSDEAYRLFYPDKHLEETVYAIPDYEYVHNELPKTGVTLKLLWKEYRDKCRQDGSISYGYTRFCNGYGEHVTAHNLTNHLSHKPGVVTEVDWSGPTMSLLDPVTREKIPVYLFVSALPYSRYAYVEPCLDMKEATWLQCHVHMYEFFGGVTVRTVCDNLKTGVVSHPREGEIVLNEAYEALGNHYMTAIMPAQVRKPKQKASAENTVGNIATAIIAELRNETFHTLDQIKVAVAEKLEEYNAAPFQKREGSRLEVFRQEESRYLNPLPAIPYEIAVWDYRKKVYPDCHVVYKKNRYSCPYQYVGKLVDLKISGSVLEIYYNSSRLTTHRLFPDYVSNQYSTHKADLPDQFQDTEWNDERIRKWASDIGPAALQVTERLFESYQLKEQAYNPAMAVLRLGKKYSSERLESACELALTRFHVPRYRHLQAILAAEEDLEFKQRKDAATRKDEVQTAGYIRGAAYYGGLKND